jgi:hypothetical protein
MVKKFYPRLLEVTVTQLAPTRWEWRVCERDTLLMTGLETSRETATILLMVKTAHLGFVNSHKLTDVYGPFLLTTHLVSAAFRC